MLSLPKSAASALILLSLSRFALSAFDLVVLHNNDLHGRFEETETNSGTCKEENRNRSCIGGFARTAHEVRRFRQEASTGTGPEVVFFVAGDIYIGTTWFSLYTWNITVEFMNKLEPDLISLGNHEFDNGPQGLVPFLKNLKCPVVAANLNLANEKELSPLVTKSAIITKGGKQIGVIGYLTPDTKSISSTGQTIFFDEVSSITEESERLYNMGINIIIAVGHSGFEMDKKIAAQVPLVDAVIGGHTNTFLWNGVPPDKEVPEGLYPTVITQASGRRVPVVQAYAYTKYLGVLNLTFDDEGEVISYGGQPIYLDSSIPQEKDVLNLLEVYRPGIDSINLQVVGQSKVILDGDSARCRSQECNFGNLVADAYAYYKQSVSAEGILPIGIQNGGGIRTTIEPKSNGDVTYGELLGALPFNNQVISMKLNGSNILKCLEIGARSNGETSKGEFLQVSGLKVVLDMSKPALSRVVSVKVRCQTCSTETWEDLQLSKMYAVVTTSFLTEGGDSHYVFGTYGENRVEEDLLDVNVVEWYFNKYSPLEPKVEGRITFAGDSSASDALKSNCMFTMLAVVIYKLFN